MAMCGLRWPMGRRPALFTETDLKRALKVVRESGMADTMRVVITRRGDILIEPISDATTITIEAMAPAADGAAPRLELVPAEQISL